MRQSKLLYLIFFSIIYPSSSTITNTSLIGHLHSNSSTVDSYFHSNNSKSADYLSSSHKCLCDAGKNCTTSGNGDKEYCVPENIKKNKRFFIANIIFVIIIGAIGNLLTLLGLPYAWIYYSHQFPTLYSSTTILLLHLSLCDLLYCLIGLPVQASIYINGYLNASDSFCFWNAWCRNLIGYTDFFTMAAIAFTRCVGIAFGQSQSCLQGLTKFFCPKATMIACLAFWLFNFLILSPTTFGAKGFGTFGYDPTHGKCEIIQCLEIEVTTSRLDILEHEAHVHSPEPFSVSPSGWYFLGSSTVPCLIIIGSYLVLSLHITTHQKGVAKDRVKSKVHTTRVNMTLLTLALAYFLFTMPELPMEFGLLDYYFPETTAFNSLCIMSWYWWIYASNFLIYVLTTKDFRTIYRIFLGDIAKILGADSLADRILP